jgi:hypothetical protein
MLGARTRITASQTPSVLRLDAFGNKVVYIGDDHYTGEKILEPYDPAIELQRLASGKLDAYDTQSLLGNQFETVSYKGAGEFIEPCWREEFRVTYEGIKYDIVLDNIVDVDCDYGFCERDLFDMYADLDFCNATKSAEYNFWLASLTSTTTPHPPEYIQRTVFVESFANVTQTIFDSGTNTTLNVSRPALVGENVTLNETVYPSVNETRVLRNEKIAMIQGKLAELHEVACTEIRASTKRAGQEVEHDMALLSDRERRRWFPDSVPKYVNTPTEMASWMRSESPERVPAENRTDLFVKVLDDVVIQESHSCGEGAPCWKNGLVRGYRRCGALLVEGLEDLDNPDKHYATPAVSEMQHIYPSSTSLLNRWLDERERNRDANGSLAIPSVCYEEGSKSGHVKFMNVNETTLHRLRQGYTECDYHSITGEPLTSSWLQSACFSFAKNKGVIFEEIRAEWDTSMPLGVQPQEYTDNNASRNGTNSSVNLNASLGVDRTSNPFGLFHNPVLSRVDNYQILNQTAISIAFEEELEFRWLDYVSSGGLSSNNTLYFYGAPKCLLKQDPCYCDSLCDNPRHGDCCLQCEPSEQLSGCQVWKASVKDKFELCDNSYKFYNISETEQFVANRFSQTQLPSGSVIYYRADTLEFRPIPIASEIGFVRHVSESEGLRVNLNLWRNVALRDNRGGPVVKPKPCWSETLNRQDLILTNIDIPNHRCNPDDYSSFCLSDLTSHTFPTLKECPKISTVIERHWSNLTMSWTVSNAESIAPQAELLSIALQNRSQESTDVFAFYNDIMDGDMNASNWSASSGSNASGALANFTLQNFTTGQSIVQNTPGSGSSLDVCYSHVLPTENTILLQNPLSCSDVARDDCWKDTPVRGYPRCELWINGSNHTWVSPMFKNHHTLLDTICWHEENDHIIFEHISSHDELTALTAGFSPCDFQVERGLAVPAEEDLIYSDENIAKVERNFRERNDLNLTDYVCWTNETTWRIYEVDPFNFMFDELGRRSPVVLRDEYEAHVRFYSLGSAKCEATTQNCYCDSICFRERFYDCCQQCWNRDTLACEYREGIMNRFEQCGKSVSSVLDVQSTRDRRFLQDPTATNGPCWQDSGEAEVFYTILDEAISSKQSLSILNMNLNYCSNETYCLEDLLGAFSDLVPCYNNTGREYWNSCYRIEPYRESVPFDRDQPVALVDRKGQELVTNVNYPATHDASAPTDLMPQGNETDIILGKVEIWGALSCTWECWKDVAVRGYRRCDNDTVPANEVCWTDNSTSLLTFNQLSSPNTWTGLESGSRRCVDDAAYANWTDWCNRSITNYQRYAFGNYTAFDNLTTEFPVTSWSDCFRFSNVEHWVDSYPSIRNQNACYIRNEETNQEFWSGPTRCPVTLTPGGNWSDPASWPLGYVPIAGEDLIIEHYQTILIDVNETAHLSSLTVHGSLIFGDPEIAPTQTLIAKSIYVGPRGVIRAGDSEDSPFLGDLAAIRLWNNDFVSEDAASQTTGLHDMNNSTTGTTTTTQFDPSIGINYYWQASSVSGSADCVPTPRNLGYCKAFIGEYMRPQNGRASECKVIIENFSRSMRRYIQGYFYGESDYSGLFWSYCYVYFQSGVPWGSSCPSTVTGEASLVNSCCPSISGTSMAWSEFGGIGALSCFIRIGGFRHWTMQVST